MSLVTFILNTYVLNTQFQFGNLVMLIITVLIVIS